MHHYHYAATGDMVKSFIVILIHVLMVILQSYHKSLNTGVYAPGSYCIPKEGTYHIAGNIRGRKLSWISRYCVIPAVGRVLIP
jgi:hypothetical protein